MLIRGNKLRMKRDWTDCIISDDKCKYYDTYGRAQSINKYVTECVPRPQNPEIREGESEQGEACGDVVRLDVRTHVCCCLHMQGVKGGSKEVWDSKNKG
jgi:hypothetical protein